MAKAFAIRATTTGETVVLSSYDPEFIVFAKSVRARFVDVSGHKAWAFGKTDAAQMDLIKTAVAAANDRAEAAKADRQAAKDAERAAAWDKLTAAQKADAYDRMHNEGGEGYNPYRAPRV